jgi:hypothetical protein
MARAKVESLKLAKADIRPRAAKLAPPRKRKCLGCGCTHNKPCLIAVMVYPPRGVARIATSVTCGWDFRDPRYCTACASERQAWEAEDITSHAKIVQDLFPDAAQIW